ncbi:MAG: hypothetical protein ACRD12_14970 [Acidimicrobiales bacterium]
MQRPARGAAEVAGLLDGLAVVAEAVVVVTLLAGLTSPTTRTPTRQHSSAYDGPVP